jgi:hypothetical protein
VLEEPPRRLIIRCAEIRLISAISFPYRYATAVAAAAEAGRRQIFLLAFHAFDDHFDLPQTFCIKTNTRLTETLSQCMCVSLSPSVRRNNNEARARSSDPQLLSACLPFLCVRAARRGWRVCNWLGLRALRLPTSMLLRPVGRSVGPIGETTRLAASFDTPRAARVN